MTTPGWLTARDSRQFPITSISIQKSKDQPVQITIKGQKLEAVNLFNYPGDTLSQAVIDAEGNCRIAKIISVFNKLFSMETLWNLLSNKNESLQSYGTCCPSVKHSLYIEGSPIIST